MDRFTYFLGCFGLSLILATLAMAQTSPYQTFLKMNVDKNTGLPRSYFVPPSYFPSVPESQRPHNAKESMRMRECDYEEVSPQNLDDYEFQTEQMLSTAGLNLYDGACWTIAQTLLGNYHTAKTYTENTLLAHKTLQFGNIKADRTCAGLQAPYGSCHDYTQDGSCGFCYGSNLVSLDTNRAYFFRMISDYWCFEGTKDARCPQFNRPWCWNDYVPVTGENSWANLIGVLQMEYINAKGNVNSIPDNSAAITLATQFLDAVGVMRVPNGGVYYAPYNTYNVENPIVGSTVSTENNVSLLSGLRALYRIISEHNSPKYKHLLPVLADYMQGVTQYLRQSYNGEYFRQGGTYNITTGVWTWTEVPFAADCQTWAISVLGVDTVDGWFGEEATIRIWNATKRISGYNYNSQTGWVEGVGFSDNVVDQVFSGEWTLGGVNMLRVMAEGYKRKGKSQVSQSLSNEADWMLQQVVQQLTSQVTFDDFGGAKGDAILYSNKRYFIPFGWWANPLPSMASTGWAVMVDNNFNPFELGGSYYPVAPAITAKF